MTSIRARLARNTALAVLVVSAVCCAGAYVLLRALLIDDFESAVEADLQSVANSVKVWTDGEIYIELNPTVLTGFAAGGDRAFVIRNASGSELIEKSISLQAANRELQAVPDAGADKIAWGQETTAEGLRALVATRVMPAQWGWDLDDTDIETAPGVRQTQVEITVSRNRAQLDRSLWMLGLITGLIAITAALTAAATAWFGAGLALRPLSALGRQVSTIDSPDGNARFDTDGPSELRPIAEGLNDLLTRLSAAAAREARFTADAAHELRTPIAELRTLTDVALAFPDDPERLESVVRNANDLSVRLTSLVEALLGIARRDTIVNDVRSDPVDVPALLRQTIGAQRAAANARGLTLTLSAPDEHVVQTDAALMGSIVSNLVGNAVDYATEGSQIAVAYSGGSNGFRLDVTNQTNGLKRADMDKLFEPFWRKSGGRTDRGHSGLGLTLSRSFADILGYDLGAELLSSDRIQLTLTASNTS